MHSEGLGGAVLGGVRGWQCSRPLGVSQSGSWGGITDACPASGLGLWCQPCPGEHDPGGQKALCRAHGWLALPVVAWLQECWLVL